MTNESILIPLKLMFLMGFTLHNLEEALWLPEWSKHAGKYHQPVERSSFSFALIIITTTGYLITFTDILFGSTGSVSNYLFLGFAGMMGINALFPHLLSTLIMKKYAPGLVSGLTLNLPLAFALVYFHLELGLNVLFLTAAIVSVSGLIIISLKPLFKLGRILTSY